MKNREKAHNAARKPRSFPPFPFYAKVLPERGGSFPLPARKHV